MSEKIKKAPAAKPTAVAKPPRKLVPRTAAQATPKPAAVSEGAIAAPKVVAGASAAKLAPIKAATKPVASRAARKPTQVQETVAKHQKVLADALVKAKAIKYEPPLETKPEAPKAAKPAKPKKVKLVRDSYAMPDTEYAQIGVLKKRLSALGNEVKKSELLRGGIAVLTALNDAELKAVMGRVDRIKTGRPAK